MCEARTRDKPPGMRWPIAVIVSPPGVPTRAEVLIDPMSDPSAADRGRGVPEALNSNDVASQDLQRGRVPRRSPRRRRYREPQSSRPRLFVVPAFQTEPPVEPLSLKEKGTKGLARECGAAKGNQPAPAFCARRRRQPPSRHSEGSTRLYSQFRVTGHRSQRNTQKG